MSTAIAASPTDTDARGIAMVLRAIALLLLYGVAARMTIGSEIRVSISVDPHQTHAWREPSPNALEET
jgi:hypothetical protein